MTTETTKAPKAKPGKRKAATPPVAATLEKIRNSAALIAGVKPSETSNETPKSIRGLQWDAKKKEVLEEAAKAIRPGLFFCDSDSGYGLGCILKVLEDGRFVAIHRGGSIRTWNIDDVVSPNNDDGFPYADDFAVTIAPEVVKLFALDPSTAEYAARPNAKGEELPWKTAKPTYKNVRAGTIAFMDTDNFEIVVGKAESGRLLLVNDDGEIFSHQPPGEDGHADDLMYPRDGSILDLAADAIAGLFGRFNATRMYAATIPTPATVTDAPTDFRHALADVMTAMGGVISAIEQAEKIQPERFEQDDDLSKVWQTMADAYKAGNDGEIRKLSHVVVKS